MSQWTQICNMRSSLLHLQYLYCSLSEKINEQKAQISRAHKDRLMQYNSLWEEFISTEQINFKRLLIIKLQSCLSVYAKDQEVWKMMDSFKTYTQVVEHDLMDNISKLYLGKRVMMDLQEVQLQLRKIQEKVVGFLNANSGRIEEYNKRVESLNEARSVFSTYMQQIRTFYKEINSNYQDYLIRKLSLRLKEIDQSVQLLKTAILR